MCNEELNTFHLLLELKDVHLFSNVTRMYWERKKKVLRWLRPRWFCISRLPGDIFDATIEECKCEPISCDELDDNLSVVSNSVLSQL